MHPALTLPEPERPLNPYTGWGRAHWEAVADHLVDGVLRFRSPGGAFLRPPGRTSWSGPASDGLEGFARSFLLAAFRLAGARGEDPRGWLTSYAEGFDAGTSREPWPLIVDRGQPLVEAASLVIGLRLTRPWLWDRLDESVRQRVVEWLSAGVRVEPVDNNWWLFSVLVADFLESVGVDDGGPVRERGLARVESFYVGRGWYSDGPNRSFDYYNGWAMHFYLGLRSYLFGHAFDASRLVSFLGDHVHFFDHTGGMIHFGRSLTYRVASVAPLWLGTLLGVSPVSPGETRRIASATLEHFVTRGAIRDGVWTAGWYGPHEPTLQAYSGSASPYWAAKGFLGLVLPPDHPAWTSPEVLTDDVEVVALPEPGFLLHRAPGDGTARLVNHGSTDHPGDPLYDRIAYSSRTGPTVAPADNTFAVLVDGEWCGRPALEPTGIGPDWAASRHVAAGVVVDAVSVVRGSSEVRIHRTPPGSTVRATGWALTSTSTAIVSGLDVRVTAGGMVAELSGLLGYDSAEALDAPEGTAFGKPAIVPALHGTGDLFVCRVALGETAPPTATAERTDRGVRITWQDGTTHTVDLDDLSVVRSDA
ncbi:DUF2264 domain-containing protein [Saccharothrix variisporea]|uniref:DUF2264 domain-containing protein n=1 Tax=Saccharothrix variisporea TaxID=543527 RepID=A0A495XMU2_9PSEU|nr:DUF2264 domain-containing protein [Saccharothrix variisporea]RKT74234.1 hypothetical protein DFJ66_7577 [Saccharothrix variisporea]